MPDEERSLNPAGSRLDDLIQGIWEESTRLETVLVVHGYPSLREALVRTLEHYGYRTLQASTREQALRVARRERLDLVLLDFELGENERLPLTETLARQAATHEIPVLGLSSDIVPNDALEHYGLREVLVMPVEQKDLLAALDRALAFSRRQGRMVVRIEPGDEQCRLSLEDRLRSNHLSLFFRFPARRRIRPSPENGGLIEDLSAKLAALGILPEIRIKGGDLLLLYDATIADALALGLDEPVEELFLALVDAFPELAAEPDALRRRLATLEGEYRRLQRIAS